MNGDQVDTIILQAVAAKALADEHARRAAWRRASAALKNFVRQPEKTFATVSANCRHSAV
jgi:hypothetical protein